MCGCVLFSEVAISGSSLFSSVLTGLCLSTRLSTGLILISRLCLIFSFIAGCLVRRLTLKRIDYFLCHVGLAF
jgi:hypothetical protein